MVAQEYSDNSEQPLLKSTQKGAKRQFLSSENLHNNIHLNSHGISFIPELEVSKKTQDIDDRKGEIRRILKRLLAIIEEHRLAALRMSVSLEAAAIQRVLLALEAETRREDPNYHLKSDDEVLSYLLTSLYEDLLAEPSNILFTTHVAKDVVRYEAMEADFWGQCVSALRQKLTPK